ncbi:MAG TPA: hypothetical protein VFD46_15060 [Chryseolinea sp.]|nr:hypothetical protein [Chryseolinea sp.]
MRFKNKFLRTVVPLALRDCWSPFSNKLTLLWSYDLLNLMKNIKVQSHKGATDTVATSPSGTRVLLLPMRTVESRQGRQIEYGPDPNIEI